MSIFTVKVKPFVQRNMFHRPCNTETQAFLLQHNIDPYKNRMKRPPEDIDKACAADIKYLRKCKAYGDNLNRDTRRFAANYMLKRSWLAPYFERIRITRPEQMAKGWFQLQDIRYYKTIYWAACLDRIHDFDIDHWVERFKCVNGRMINWYLIVKADYYKHRFMMRKHIDRALRPHSRWYDKRETDDLMEILKMPFMSWAQLQTTQMWSQSYGFNRLLLISMVAGYETAREYMRSDDEFYEHVIRDVIRNAWKRSLLKSWLGLSRKLDGAYVTDKDCDGLVEDLFGYNLNELHAMAGLYADRIRDWLREMRWWRGPQHYWFNDDLYIDEDRRKKFELEAMSIDYQRHGEFAGIGDELSQIEHIPDVSITGSVGSGSIPPAVMRLAQSLSSIHGPVAIALEASGHHIYMADPELLAKDGEKEFTSRHLAINADKYFGIGQYDIDLHPTPENRKLYKEYYASGKEMSCAMSMKTRRKYMVSELMQYLPVHKRGIGITGIRAKVITGAVNKRLVRDENGNLVPEWPGAVIPLTELPKNHPAVEYLQGRGYSLSLLEEQFECGYCEEALPESRGEGRYYSRLPGGMKNSPQGRIIFSVRMNGVRLGWQARLIDKWVNGHYYVWSDQKKWMLVRSKNEDGTTRELYPPTQEFPKGFAPHKYINAVGSERNKLLMGFDAAVQYNKGKPHSQSYCVLVEGPLDAGRIGPPAIALLGKSISPYQAASIRSKFSMVLTIMDNDAAGRQCLKRIYKELPHTNIIELQLPDSVKDVGELGYLDAFNLVNSVLP